MSITINKNETGKQTICSTMPIVTQLKISINNILSEHYSKDVSKKEHQTFFFVCYHNPNILCRFFVQKSILVTHVVVVQSCKATDIH